MTVIGFLLLLLAACGTSDNAPEPVTNTFTGTVQLPAQVVAMLNQHQPTLLARLLGFISTSSWADISGSVGGFVPVSGVTVELVRLTYDPVTNSIQETVVGCDGGCPLTDSSGNFTIYTSEAASSDLALRVSFIDPADGVTPVVMRALVYGNSVDVTPISEAAAQLIFDSLDVGGFVSLSDFTTNEVGSLVKLIEDEDIDLTGQDFTTAINTIKNYPGNLLSDFINGFKSGGEMNIANPNDVFHIVELRNQLIAPNGTYLTGAVNFESTTGGAVSFDDNGAFQNGSALYYWGLRSDLLGNSPVRLFDQPLDQQAQYGIPVGFRGLTATDSGMVVANSNTEATTYGFLSNDGGLIAVLSERNDDTQSIYDRGLRILMREWKDTSTDVYNDVYTNNTINYLDGINGNNTNSGNHSSIDLNPAMGDSGGQPVDYNVVMYQNYLTDSGIEIGAGTGQWTFDATGAQVLITDTTTSPPTNKYYGYTTVSSQNLDAVQYQYATGTLTTPAVKTLEPCPNLFAIAYGGTLNMRRDDQNALCNGVSADVFAGSGAVTSDTEVFVVPQVFDDKEDDQALELPMDPGTAARRGWYIGIRQPTTALTTAMLSGRYHVVGQVTEFDDTADSISYETFHGTLDFTGVGGIVAGTLYKKQATLDGIGGASPLLSRTASVAESVNGTYSASVGDGTISFSMPGTTDSVTGIAGQVRNFNGSDTAMLIVVPISRYTTGTGAVAARGVMLLSHEFLTSYPVPPDPPTP